MQGNNHTKFILTPILNILKETVIACRGIGYGIETQSICEYVMQTTFLKMTGALEQKMKCICWEIASNDYEYRYQYLKKKYGECSNFKDKNSVYKDLIKAIVKLNKAFDYNSIFSDIDISIYRKDIINQKIDTAIFNQVRKKGRELSQDEITKLTNGMIKYYMKQNLDSKDKIIFTKKALLFKLNNDIIKLINNTPIAAWEQHDFKFFKSNWNDIYCDNFVSENLLLNDDTQKFYNEIVYEHRNRCAHNLTSYQNNLPTLQTLRSGDYKYSNYFFRFSILVLIDDIFMRLFNNYVVELKSRTMF